MVGSSADFYVAFKSVISSVKTWTVTPGGDEFIPCKTKIGMASWPPPGINLSLPGANAMSERRFRSFIEALKSMHPGSITKAMLTPSGVCHAVTMATFVMHGVHPLHPRCVDIQRDILVKDLKDKSVFILCN